MFNIPGLINFYELAFRSLNFIQGAVDYWQNALPFFWIKFNESSTWLQHNHWDHSENPGRYLYGAVLSRIILGRNKELPVERLFKEQIYKSILSGEAMSFRPNPSPYEAVDSARDAAADQAGLKKQFVMEADLWDNRSVFTGLILNYKTTGDEKALNAALKMIEKIKALAVWEGDCAFFEEMAYPQGYIKGCQPGSKIFGQNMGGWISPLVYFFRSRGDEKALHLAAGLSLSFVRALPVPIAKTRDLPVQLNMNVHSLLHTVAGVARTSRITGNRELLDWAKLQYDEIIANLSSQTGWTKEFLPAQNYSGIESCETCALADRIDAGIQLALAGHTECWNDVQRAAVNYLAEAQFKDNCWMPVDTAATDDYYRNYHYIRERLVGAYVGWGAPNDLVEPQARVAGSVQNCCGPHGAFGAYQVWHNAVQKEGKKLFVHLAISRDSPWCSVIVRHPFEGEMEFELKEDTALHVRLPRWTPIEKVEVRVNGNNTPLVSNGSYVVVHAQKGDQVKMLYPLQQEELVESINGQPYRTQWKGDYVVRIDPPGTVAPLYQGRDKSPLVSEKPSWPPSMEEIDW